MALVVPYDMIQRQGRKLYLRVCDDCGQRKYIQLSTLNKWCQACSRKHSRLSINGPGRPKARYCKYGHPTPGGAQRCKVCARERAARSHARRMVA